MLLGLKENGRHVVVSVGRVGISETCRSPGGEVV